MLLDEPFASLDPNLRDPAARRHRRRSSGPRGTPALFVTHDQAEALSIGDRVAVMRAGRIEQVGSPDDVFHRPVNRFVAGFMGEAAFLPVARRRAPSSDRSPATGSSPTAPWSWSGRTTSPSTDAPGHADTEVTVVAGEFQGPTRTLHPAAAERRRWSAPPYPTRPVLRRRRRGARASLRPGDHAVVTDDAR